MSVNDEVATHYGSVPSSDEFSIKTTAKAFEVLSSKLYKNKIEAIVRELSCNAYDSHVSAGHPERPFDVILPTIFDPRLVIRDYGTGLNDNDVRTVFTKFFESTKENSNALIGALGLGCKSPFSYVESFSVISYMDGQRMVYECFRERGIPRITQRSVMSTNEDNGLEISVPVQPDDNDRFVSAARRIFKWFLVRPNILSGDIGIPNMPKFNGRWAQSDDGSMEAIMGQVRYPIDRNMVCSEGLNGVAIQFDIGELDIQAGREELSYDPTTIANINKRIQDVIGEVDKLYSIMFKGCTNIYEASVRLKKLRNEGKILSCRPPTYKGFTLHRDPVADYLARYSKFRPSPYQSHHDRKILYNDTKTKRSDSNPKNFMVFVGCRNDGGKDMQRLNIWRKENPKKFGYFIQRSSVDDPTFIEAMEGIPFASSDTVQLPKVLAKVRKCSTLEIRSAPEINIDLNEAGYYVISRNLEWAHPHDREAIVSRIESATLYSLVKELFPQEMENAVYFPSSRKKSLTDDWIDIYDLLAKKYEEVSKGKEFKQGISKALAWKKFSEDSHWQTAIIAASKQITTDSKLGRWLQRMADFSEWASKYHRWCHYEEMIGVRRRSTIDLNAEWSEIKQRYPVIVELIRPRGSWPDVRERNIALSDLNVYALVKEKA